MTTRSQRLDSVADICMGQAPSGEAYNSEGEGWPLLAGAGDFKDGLPAAKKFTREAPRTCIPGDIIIGVRASIGDKVVADREYCLGRGVAALRPRSGLHHRYLWHWLSVTRQRLEGKGKGATFKQVTKEDVAELEIPLPPLEEQRRIAAVLDKAQDIKALSDKAGKLSELADRSLFLHFFGEQPGSNQITLADIADRRPNAIRTGPFGSQLLHSEFTEAGIAVLGIDNAVTNDFAWGKRRYISEEKYSQLVRYTVFPGDLLITIMGTCGRVAVVPDDIPTAINTKHLCAISVDQDAVLPDYLHHYILYHPSAAKYLARQTKGAIMEGLNMSIIKQMPILLPPLEKQLRWHSRRKYVRAIASKNRQSQGGMSRLASSLNQILLNSSSS